MFSGIPRRWRPLGGVLTGGREVTMGHELRVSVWAVVRWVIAGTVVFVLVGLYLFEHNRTAELRVQIALLREVRTVEAEHYNGIAQVNLVCEAVVTDLVERLRLPPDVQPLLTKAITGRAASLPPVMLDEPIVPVVPGGMGGGDE